MLILRVGPRDNGEYKVVIENKLGTAESSMMLNVRGMNTCSRFKKRYILHKETDEIV